MIDSVNNEKILFFKKLRDKKYILENNMFIVEGEHLVEEAYKSGILLEVIKSNKCSISYDVKTTIVSDKCLEKISLLKSTPNIMGVVKFFLSNKIVGKKSATVGNKPGVTKNLNWVRASKDIELLDSPGILWPKLEQETVAYNLASMTAIKEEILDKQDVAVYIIKTLYKLYPSKLEEFYNITSINDFEEVFDTIARQKGLLQKGGVPNYDRVIDLIINDIKSGKIKDITFDRISYE